MIIFDIYLMLIKLKIHFSAVQFGKDMEHIAINMFEEISGFQVKPCGLYIDEEYPYLAASPG